MPAAPGRNSGHRFSGFDLVRSAQEIGLGGFEISPHPSSLSLPKKISPSLGEARTTALGVQGANRTKATRLTGSFLPPSPADRIPRRREQQTNKSRCGSGKKWRGERGGGEEGAKKKIGGSKRHTLSVHSCNK